MVEPIVSSEVCEKEPADVDENSTSSSGVGESIDESVTYDADSVNGFILTEEVINEEKHLNKLNELRANERRAKELRNIEKEQLEKELMERRHQGLLSLLEKSQFYANFALKSIENSEQALLKATNKKRKRPANNTIFGVTNTEELVSAAKRKKVGDVENEYLVPEDVDDSTRTTELGLVVPLSQPVLLSGACLRKYQLEGLDWMKRLYVAGINGILADEMGLGKTVQTISLICHMYEFHNNGPFLIVAPLSTLPNWIIEFENFAPDVPTVMFHGNEASRKELKAKIAPKYNLLGKNVYPVVITSYEVPLREENFLLRYVWKYIIVDEGHRVKNHKSALSRCLSRLNSVNRLLLTGTPLQNELSELWALLHFLIPEMFKNLEDFSMWLQVEEFKENEKASVVEKEKNSQILTKLHDIVAPFLLRRLKRDVELSLPPKKELIVYCPLSEMQYALYSWIVNTAIANLSAPEPEVDVNAPKKKRSCVIEKLPLAEKRRARLSNPVEMKRTIDPVFHFKGQTFKCQLKMANPMMILRKVSNHPLLVEAADSVEHYTVEQLINYSGKMMMLDTLLKKLKAGGHKVLIFSCFTNALSLIEDALEFRGHKYVRLDGKTDIEERKENIRLFNANPDMFVFLLSTRAGGLGINLPSADTVIFFDSDWNPQADLQAQDRCHRIGQTKPVIVYRLVSRGTIDEKIVSKAQAKRKLEKAVIGAGRFGYCGSGVRPSMLVDLEFLKSLLEEKQNEITAEDEVLSQQQWAELLDRNFT